MKIGATGKYPEGMARRPGDEGELNMAISDPDGDGLIHIDFGKPVAWLALSKETAMALGKMLMAKAGKKKIEVTL